MFFQLMPLHWGQLSINFKVLGGALITGKIESLEGSGTSSLLKGTSSVVSEQGSGLSRNLRGSGKSSNVRGRGRLC